MNLRACCGVGGSAPAARTAEKKARHAAEQIFMFTTYQRVRQGLVEPLPDYPWPYCMRSRSVLLVTMPMTTDVNSENNTAASKCDRFIVISFSSLRRFRRHPPSPARSTAPRSTETAFRNRERPRLCLAGYTRARRSDRKSTRLNSSHLG